MSKEPMHKKGNTVTSLTSITPLVPGPSTPEPAHQQPEDFQSSDSVSADTAETTIIEPKQVSAGSDCMESCWRDIETGTATQLIIDKKETARSLYQRYFNAEWYKNSD